MRVEKVVKRLLLAALAVVSTACVLISQRTEVRSLDAVDGTVVTSPVKAHLTDGSTVVYPKGVTVAGGVLRGEGVRYDLTLAFIRQTAVDTVPLDSVVGMETFEAKANVASSIVGSALASLGAYIGTASMIVGGNCS